MPFLSNWILNRTQTWAIIVLLWLLVAGKENVMIQHPSHLRLHQIEPTSDGNIFTSASASERSSMVNTEAVSDSARSIHADNCSSFRQGIDSKASSSPPTAAELITKFWPQLKANPGEHHEVPQPIFCLESDLSSNKGKSATCSVKLDAPFVSCVNHLNDKGNHLRPMRREVSKNLFGDKDFKAFFKAPSVPETAIRVGDSKAKRLPSKHNPLRTNKFQKFESQLLNVERSARTSMRLATFQTYLLTAQREADRLNISTMDRKHIADLIIQISELQFEQAARTTLLTTRVRTAWVLEQLQIKKNATTLLEKLPVQREDLFGGKFQKILDSSLTAASMADKTVYKLSAISTYHASKTLPDTRYRETHRPSYNHSGLPRPPPWETGKSPRGKQNERYFS
ncbi:uncharacterized protein [Diadema antillarum]|uniref:uncharacterized protein n=1 Tax=Diadema antillarum TaxID=105358 RepID=UPI003A8572AF